MTEKMTVLTTEPDIPDATLTRKPHVRLCHDIIDYFTIHYRVLHTLLSHLAGSLEREIASAPSTIAAFVIKLFAMERSRMRRGSSRVVVIENLDALLRDEKIAEENKKREKGKEKRWRRKEVCGNFILPKTTRAHYLGHCSALIPRKCAVLYIRV